MNKYGIELLFFYNFFCQIGTFNIIFDMLDENKQT